MTHRPPNGLLVFFMSSHSVSPSTSLLVRTCWPYTDTLSADHVLSSHVALMYDKYCWSTAAASGTPAEDMAAKAGWICSAGSSGSASSLRSIRALSRYTPSPDLLSNRSSTAGWASITIITVQLLTDAGLLQVHVFTINVVAPYNDIYTKKWARFLLQVYRKDTSVCPNNLISISIFRWQFQFRRVGLSARLIVGELVCRRVVHLP